MVVWLCLFCVSWFVVCFFCYKQKTAYEMRISDWSSDVCSSDLGRLVDEGPRIADIDFSGYRMRVPTGRYWSQDYARRERDALWLRIWQVTGRDRQSVV